MKNIIITSGPTNERIDSVMKITNMSTGALGAVIADTLQESYGQEIGKIFYLSTKMSRKPSIEKVPIEYVTIESTQDLIDALKDIFEHNTIDVMIHSAAVGDYTGKFSIRAEDLAGEIATLDLKDMSYNEAVDAIMEVFENPKAVADNSGKMSSYEPHLMVALGLTPKVIGMVKDLSPNTILVGFKLLDGVSKDELFNVADRLRQKNRADYIVANDLSKIRNSKHWAMIVGKDGIVTECETKKEIAIAIGELTI